jgi:hypothetical protein
MKLLATVLVQGDSQSNFLRSLFVERRCFLEGLDGVWAGIGRVSKWQLTVSVHLMVLLRLPDAESIGLPFGMDRRRRRVCASTERARMRVTRIFAAAILGSDMRPNRSRKRFGGCVSNA